MDTTTILLVEDELLHRRMYETALKKLPQVRVLTAAEEGAALKLIRQERPAIILLDLVVPRAAPKPGDISFHEPVGLSILRAIKKDPQTKAARVIIFSNLDADEHKQKAKALGAEAYLIKANVPPHALTDFISGFLKQT